MPAIYNEITCTPPSNISRRIVDYSILIKMSIFIFFYGKVDSTCNSKINKILFDLTTFICIMFEKYL